MLPLRLSQGIFQSATMPYYNQFFFYFPELSFVWERGFMLQLRHSQGISSCAIIPTLHTNLCFQKRH